MNATIILMVLFFLIISRAFIHVSNLLTTAMTEKATYCSARA